MNIWGRILKLFCWSVDITAPRRDKCVICVAPHTSNWDFILGQFAYRSIGRKANFLIKESWFFFPFNLIFKALGGIPVSRNKKDGKSSLTESIIEKFNTSDYLNLAITPEGTRSARADWKTGFLVIACGAHVPIQLGVIDYSGKKVIIQEEFQPTDDIGSDLNAIKQYYSRFKDAARYPDKFRIS